MDINQAFLSIKKACPELQDKPFDYIHWINFD